MGIIMTITTTQCKKLSAESNVLRLTSFLIWYSLSNQHKMLAPSNCISDMQCPTRLTSYTHFSQKATGGYAPTNEGGTFQKRESHEV